MLMAPCADCGELVGNVHRCPGCDSNMHSFCGIGVGDEGYGQQRTCKKMRGSGGGSGGGSGDSSGGRRGPAAAAKPPTVAPATMMQLQPGLVPPPTNLRTTMFARNLHSLTRRAPTSEWRYAHATTAPRLFRLQRP